MSNRTTREWFKQLDGAVDWARVCLLNLGGTAEVSVWGGGWLVIWKEHTS